LGSGKLSADLFFTYESFPQIEATIIGLNKSAENGRNVKRAAQRLNEFRLLPGAAQLRPLRF